MSEFDSPQPFQEADRIERQTYPFWTYRDLGLFLPLAVGAFLVVSLLSVGMLHVLPPALVHKTLLLVFAQTVGYALVLAALYSIVAVHYGRGFREGLAWIPSQNITSVQAILLGFGLSIAVAVLGSLLGAPEDTPMKEIVLADWRSFISVLLVGVTIGPVFEEIVFRGFLQPLLVRSLGPVLGILLAALPFGLLHLQQYGFNWQQGVLITLAGAAFGWVRERSGSTRTAAIMHMAYNSTVFLAVLANPKELPTTW